jgi:streptomycin 6-kinase
MSHDDIRTLARQWGVALDGPVRQSPTGRVGFGRRGASHVVIKIPDPGEDEANSLAVMLHFRGNGAVTVLDHDGGAMLLERAVRGRPLSELVVCGRDDEATGVLCDVMTALHRPELPAQSFPSIEDWGRELDEYRASKDMTIPSALVDRAIGLFAELVGSQGQLRLLHGDLHHDNVLYDDHRGWLAIDPKGVIGESSYEVGAALRNPTEDTTRFAVPSIIERRIAIICERLGFDRHRLLAWTFAQGVLSAVWQVQDGRYPTTGLATACAVLPLLEVPR